MRQYFGQDIILDCDKKTGNVVLLNRGENVESWEDVSLSELELIQAKAASLTSRG